MAEIKVGIIIVATSSSELTKAINYPGKPANRNY